jgi:hypothetical protein
MFSRQGHAVLRVLEQECDMTPGTHVRITPLTQWARNKVHQHGDVFVVMGTGKRGVLVTSLKMTFKNNGGCEFWSGWFGPEDALLTPTPPDHKEHE